MTNCCSGDKSGHGGHIWSLHDQGETGATRSADHRPWRDGTHSSGHILHSTSSGQSQELHGKK